MIKTIIAAALLALVSNVSCAQTSGCNAIAANCPRPVAPQQPGINATGDEETAVVVQCPKHWQRVISGNMYCLLGMPASQEIKEERQKHPDNPIVKIGPADDPIIIDMSHGAPIALPADEDEERQRAVDARDHGARPYSGHGR